MGAEAARPANVTAAVVGTSLMAESAGTAANVLATPPAATDDNAMEECPSQPVDHSLTVSRPPETAPAAAEHLDSFVAATAPAAQLISVAGAEAQVLTTALAATSDSMIASPPQHPDVGASGSTPPLGVSSSASSPSPSDTEMAPTDAASAPYDRSFFLKVTRPPSSAPRQQKRKSRILRAANRAKKRVELASIAQLSHQSTSSPAPAAESAPAITTTSQNTPAASPTPTLSTFNPPGDGACLFHCINHALFQDASSPSVIRNLLHANLNATSSSTPQDPLCPRSQLLWGDESEIAAIPALSPSTRVILFNTDPEQFLAYPDIPPTTPDAKRMVLLRLTKPALHYALICVNGRSIFPAQPGSLSSNDQFCIRQEAFLLQAKLTEDRKLQVAESQALALQLHAEELAALHSARPPNPPSAPLTNSPQPNSHSSHDQGLSPDKPI